MRPINRGSVPVDGLGNAKVFAQYADAREDLFTRIGRYCSFCERLIKAGLAIEHIRHKNAYPALEREWTNFLLACGNCNSTKSTKAVGRFLFLPDRDNTFRAIEYQVGGLVNTVKTLRSSLKAKATRLIRLVGLDKVPSRDPQAKDLRWNDRRESWDKAARYLRKYQTGTIGIDEVAELCQADGHWSIWMTVFAGVRPVRLALIAAFPGTANCFDQ
jgi:uncharacterized protein (TIGR02646 family)